MHERRDEDEAPKQSGGSPILQRRQGNNLPHWRLDGAVYAVTFRLCDSIPAEVLRRWKAEREHTVKRAEALGRPLTGAELTRLAELHSEKVEAWLDQGEGSCALRDARLALLVRDAMLYFDKVRYDLLAWCVMPNHAHGIVRPAIGVDLSKVLQSWKGFTGREALKHLGKLGSGEFWQKESYDHIVRDEADLERQVRYVMENPMKSGLRNWAWVGCREDWRVAACGPARVYRASDEGEKDTGRKPGSTGDLA